MKKGAQVRSRQRIENRQETLLAHRTIEVYLQSMLFTGRTISKISMTLRIFLMLALLSALNTSHIGMGAQPIGLSMTMTHAGQTQDQANHTGPKHSKMSDSLCATLCLGAGRLDGGVVVGRVEKFVLATWLGEINPAWTSPIPDPALRPPDTLQLT